MVLIIIIIIVKIKFAKKLFIFNFKPIKSVSNCESDSKLTRFSFQTSPKMSTYLVAYLVGDYDFVEEMSKLGVLVRIYTPVGQTELGKFSMQVNLGKI